MATDLRLVDVLDDAAGERGLDEGHERVESLRRLHGRRDAHLETRRDAVVTLYVHECACVCVHVCGCR